MKKIISLALSAVFGLSAMAQTIVWESDFVENIDGVTQTKAKSGDSWGDAPTWASPYTKMYNSSSTSSKLTMEFTTPFSLQENDSIFVYWGSPSNRVLNLAINNETGVEIDKIADSSERSKLRQAKYCFKAATTLSKLVFAFTGGSNTEVFHIAIVKGVPPCTPVTDPLTLKLDTISESEGLYVGDKIKLTLGGTGNGAAQELTLDGAAFSGTEWTATAGEHTFALTQEVNAGACGTDIEIKLSVAEKTPVTAAKITGVASVVVNKEVTLTCEAENATDYQWYKGTEKIDGATDATYTFKPDAAGDVVFKCEVWNKLTASDIFAEFSLSVTEAPEVCGMLIQATTQQVVTGVVGGTVTTNMSKGSSQKLDKSKHFGVTLADGEFAEGDIFIMNITAAADVAGSLKLYADTEGSVKIAEITDNLDGTGEKRWALPAAAAGKNSIYVVRGNVSDWNPKFSYIAIKRKCAGESDDASVTSFKINDQDVSAVGGTYSYEVPEDYMGTEIEVKFELAAGATADQASPLKIKVPNAGETTEVKITVTAQDGETKAVYIIKVSKAAAPKSTDASITELKINNEVVAENEGAFAYEVAAEATLDSVEVVFTVAEKATANPASPFKVLVPEAGAAAIEAAIKVTAEDGTTVKEYKVSVTKAKKTEALDNVADETKVVKVIRDGQLYILKNGVLYNAQGTAL